MLVPTEENRLAIRHYIRKYMPPPPPPIDVIEVYGEQVVAAVQAKLRWFRQTGFPERAVHLSEKFRQGLPLAPCEYNMGPTVSRDPHLTARQLRPPKPGDDNARAWAKYAFDVSDIDPEVLRESTIPEMKEMLIVLGVYDPDWETHPPQDTTVDWTPEPEVQA